MYCSPMMGAAELALVVAKAVAGEIGKPIGRGISDRVLAAIGRAPAKQALANALERTLQRFAQELGTWTSSFFDAHFLEARAAPLIARMISTGDAPTAREFAVAWREQFGPGTAGIDDVEPAAAAFLRILRQELRTEQQFRDVIASNTLEEIAGAVVIGERQAGESPVTEPGAKAPTEAPPAWRVKAPSAQFTDRDAEIDGLHSTLRESAICAVHGLGGVGKSQLAAQYARRHRDDYDVAWWVRAEDEQTRTEDLAGLAYAVRAASRSDADQRTAADAAKRWLEQHDRWLLILDNAPDPYDLQELIPANLTGHVIVTSRRHADWLAVGAAALELAVWDREDAVRFLMQRTGLDDAEAAESIAEALGDLPLALEQAGGYTNRQRISLAEYLKRLGERDRDLLSSGTPADYGRSVATTWSLALDEVSAHPTARLVLAVCAFLSPEDIPRDVFYTHVADASTGGPAAALLDDAIELLLSYSLIDASGASLSIHRLVQRFTRELIGAPGAQDAVTLMFAAFPRADQHMEQWPTFARLLPHALAALEHAEAADVRPEITVELLVAAASYLRVRGDLAASQNLLERALGIADATFGPNDVRAAPTLNDLGITCRERGDLDRALKLTQRALDLLEFDGTDQLRIANTRINLAVVLDHQHRLDEALALYEAAMPVVERADNPWFTAAALVDVAIVLDQRGNFTEAKARYEQALAIEMTLPGGATHPRIGDTRVNLSITLLHLDEVDAARAEAESAVAIYSSAFQGDHPQLARALDQLGTVLLRQNDLDRARSTFESALEMARRVYPSLHPSIGQTLANLGIVARRQGDPIAAREKYLEALEIQTQTLGPEHPDVGRTNAALGLAASSAGDGAPARRYFARAQLIQLKARGPQHPEVVDLLRLAGLDPTEITRPDQVDQILLQLERVASEH
jgi:tetratricopeptide (TPR) repeat protein